MGRNTESAKHGLYLWRQRKELERQYKIARLEELRLDAHIEVRDGIEFRVVRIPDQYGMRAPLNLEGWQQGDRQ